MQNNIRIAKPIQFAAIILLPALIACLSSCITREYAVVQNYEETEYRTEYYAEGPGENTGMSKAASVEYSLSPYYYWNSYDLYFKDVSRLWYYGYDLPELPEGAWAGLKIYMQPQLQYEKMYLSVFDMTRSGHIDSPDPVGPTGNSEKGLVQWAWITGSATSTWLDWANERMSRARFIGGRSNVWTRSGEAQLIELNAGNARTIAVIISGPTEKWNGDFTLSVVSTYANENNQLTGREKLSRQVPYTVQKQRIVYEFRQIPLWEAVISR